MNDELLKNMRHSCAHLLAAAVQELWPDTKFGVGPTIEDGFYYDFDLSHRIVDEDFAAIEAKMKELAAKQLGYEREELSIDEARERMEKLGQPYKVELINDIEKTGSTKLGEEGEKTGTVTFYKTGEFVDLCRGGHVDVTTEIGPFKLLSVAGAYWRGKEGNPMMQRVYGTCWATQAELDAYLARIEEAKRRDHRKLGQQLDLFTFSDLVGAGLPLFTPKGTMLRQVLEDFVWKLMAPHGYQRVRIPHLAKSALYKTSGHYDKFKDDTYFVRSGRDGDAEYMLKPMNCPHHTQIYASKPHSYRDLPIRYSEVTQVYRSEYSGELHGLTRVLSITQDDAHIFCRLDQIQDEVQKLYEIVQNFYSAFEMPLSVRLSVSNLKTPEKYLGDPVAWARAEKKLAEVLESNNQIYDRAEGEAAFYGPKIDFVAHDSLNREWQLATIQLDFNQPVRFGLEYSNESGEKETPIMIHRAISGSLERFMGVLIEHYAGKFPTWLAPVQVKILPIADRHSDYAELVKQQLEQAGYRVEVDVRAESVGKKIRSAQLEQIPYMLVVGDKEIEANQVAVRAREAGDLGTMTAEDFVAKLNEEPNPLEA